MAEQEKYIEGQKHCGIGVGDTVRVVRAAEDYEGGWKYLWFSYKNCVDEFVVQAIDHQGGGMEHITDGGVHWWYPYFVLEIVKKADGSVPGKVNNTNTERNSTMKTQKIFSVVVSENEHVKDAETSQIIATKKRPIFSKPDMPAYDEKNAGIKGILAAGKVKGVNAIKDEDEVEVLVRPFCG